MRKAASIVALTVLTALDCCALCPQKQSRFRKNISADEREIYKLVSGEFPIKPDDLFCGGPYGDCIGSPILPTLELGPLLHEEKYYPPVKDFLAKIETGTIDSYNLENLDCGKFDPVRRSIEKQAAISKPVREYFGISWVHASWTGFNKKHSQALVHVAAGEHHEFVLLGKAKSRWSILDRLGFPSW